MDWLKKKKDEAKKAASQATAKMTNKRTAFRGEGNVLGGGESAAPAAAAPPKASSGIKMPSFGASKQPEVSEEEQKRRRELQQKALDQRGNAWEKRVNNARKVRLQQEEEQNARFSHAVSASPSPSDAASAAPNGPPLAVLSNEEVKARELRNAHEQMGFNPYAATFSSSTQATSAMNSIAGGSSAPPVGTGRGGAMPPPAPVASPHGIIAEAESGEGGAVYVLLRQDPQRAITAAETLIKMLSNVVKNPEEEKFRKVRLSNTAIQNKLVAVRGAVDLLEEAGFSRCELDGESYLMLAADAFQAERVQSTLDRTEVALIQLQHDLSNA